MPSLPRWTWRRVALFSQMLMKIRHLLPIFNQINNSEREVLDIWLLNILSWLYDLKEFGRIRFVRFGRINDFASSIFFVSDFFLVVASINYRTGDDIIYLVNLLLWLGPGFSTQNAWRVSCLLCVFQIESFKINTFTWLQPSIRPLY